MTAKKNFTAIIFSLALAAVMAVPTFAESAAPRAQICPSCNQGAIFSRTEKIDQFSGPRVACQHGDYDGADVLIVETWQDINVCNQCGWQYRFTPYTTSYYLCLSE